MVSLRWTSMAIVMLLAGRASSAGPSSSTVQYSPATSIWSTLNPVNWFRSPLLVTEQGVGQITASTPMNQSAISAGLNNSYRLRRGMESNGGRFATLWQALQGQQVKLEIRGQSTVRQVEVMDETVRGPAGVATGMLYSQLYGKAFGICQIAEKNQSTDVVCQAPDSQHIWYQFSGQWHGPAGLMPDDLTLKNWQLNKIIWKQ